MFSYLLARAATQRTGSRAARLARRISVIPVVVFGVYMLVVIPTRTIHHIVQARVVSNGQITHPSLSHLDQQAGQPILGVSAELAPCKATYIVRTTPVRDPHLERAVPSKETRACLESLQVDSKVDVEVEITRRWLSSEVKSYSISRIGDCTLHGSDRGARLTSGFCAAWVH